LTDAADIKETGFICHQLFRLNKKLQDEAMQIPDMMQ
jgi:hypothetical protein